MYKMTIYPGVLFCFFLQKGKVWFLGPLGVKRDKKCPKNATSHSLSQELYIIWSSFIAHMCKMIISAGVFLFFSKCSFSVLFRGRGGRINDKKMVQNDKNVCPSRSLSQEPYVWSSYDQEPIWSSFMVHIITLRMIFPISGTHMIFIYGAHV